MKKQETGTPMVKRVNQSDRRDIPIGHPVEPKNVASFEGDLYRNETISGDVVFIHGNLHLGSKV
jgi:hypothetical protein